MSFKARSKLRSVSQGKNWEGCPRQPAGTAALTAVMWERAWLVGETGRRSCFWSVIEKRHLGENGIE